MRTAEKERLRRLGVQVPDILLPAPDVSPETFAVVACDQHSAEPAYWEQTRRLVGQAPVSYTHLTLPTTYTV